VIEASPRKNIILVFLKWHFFEAPKSILKGIRNFLWFNFNFFSIGFHLKTFFAHWRNYRESYGRGFDPKRYAWVFFGNLISRIIGMIARTIMIIMGIVVEIITLVVGASILASWIILPFLLIIGLQKSLSLLFFD